MAIPEIAHSTPNESATPLASVVLTVPIVYAGYTEPDDAVVSPIKIADMLSSANSSLLPEPVTSAPLHSMYKKSPASNETETSAYFAY